MDPSLYFLHTDAKILDLIRKRDDEEALVFLYRANRRSVTSYVTNNSGSSDDAEDVLQEALVILWERVRSGKFQYEAKLSTFIMATAKNIWMRRLARRKREVPGAARIEETTSGDPSALDELIENERKQLVRSALEKLGDPCKKLLLLFYWEELSLVEIASQMHFANADTVKSKKYQCKKALEQLLRHA